MLAVDFAEASTSSVSDSTPVNILVLAWDIPATTNMPGSPRLFNLCKELSRSHRLTLAAFSLSQERYDTFLADPAQRGVFQEDITREYLDRLRPQ